MAISSSQLELLSQQLNHAHRNAVAAELAARGLSEVGHPVLLTILKYYDSQEPNGGCSAQRELAERLHISPAAVADSLKSLEKGGYICRTPRMGDARRNQVGLTEKGRWAAEGCQEVFVAVSQRMLAGFTQEEREQLLSFRRRMLQNLRGCDGAQAPAKEEL